MLKHYYQNLLKKKILMLYLYALVLMKRILDIKSSIFSLDFINPSNQKRLDLIFKLHKEGKTNKEIVHHLKIHKIKRRNKDDNYSVKDVFMCIKKLKKREERIKDIKYKLGKWKLLREY